MSAGSDPLVPGLPLTREQALALPGMRRYRLVEFLIRWEHFGAARELLESLVDRKTGRFFYQYRLAQCYLATGDVEEARRVARELYSASRTRAIGTLAVGDVYYVEGRLSRAEEYYRQALEVEKTRESARRRLAWCLLHRRNMVGAAALAEELTAGKKLAQLPPAAVRLLAAVAQAGGETDQAASLRRDLRSRWRQELDRLRDALELALDRAGLDQAGGAGPGLAPPEGEEAEAAPARPSAEASGIRGAEEQPRSQSTPEPTAPPDASATPALSSAPSSDRRGNASSGIERDRPRAAETTDLPAAGRDGPLPGGQAAPTSGYVYPTARERRAAAETAARQQAARQRKGVAGEPRVEPVAGAESSRPHAEDGNLRPGVTPSSGAPSPPDAGALRAALKELFGYDQFRSGQEAVVRHVLEGRSVLATMPTGSGKSLCFQLPAMLLPRATVVISPLIALMQDQIEGLPPRVRARATVLNSSLESMEQEQRLRTLASGGYSLVYAAPERLRQQPFLHALRRCGVSLLVVDEAHCISLWGQDFRPDYLFLPKLLQELSHPPVLAMTATATTAMQADIREQFGVPMETVSQGVFRPNLRLEVRRCADKSAKLKALRELCLQESGAMIVYVSARARAEHLAQAIGEAGISADFYHAGLPAEQREATQQQFMRGETRCLVATVAFGMGVDKPDIRLIVHHDLPRSLEGYYQEAGRAGRDGQPARCVLFTSPGDRAILSRRAREDRIAFGEVLRMHRIVTAMAGSLTLAADDLERETGLDETRVRVALSVLERAGALRRRFDLPRVCSLTVLREGDAPFARFVAAAHLRQRQKVVRDTSELCELTGIPPDELEPQLLSWVDAGWLEYRGSARGLRVELLLVPDLAERVQEILRAMERVDDARLNHLDEYVRTATCRHRFLSDYFAVPAGAASENGSGFGRQEGCGGCDNCGRRSGWRLSALTRG